MAFDLDTDLEHLPKEVLERYRTLKAKFWTRIIIATIFLIIGLFCLGIVILEEKHGVFYAGVFFLFVGICLFVRAMQYRASSVDFVNSYIAFTAALRTPKDKIITSPPDISRII